MDDCTVLPDAKGLAMDIDLSNATPMIVFLLHIAAVWY
jgi:hypothetical protein